MINKYVLIAFGTRPEWIKLKPLIDIFIKNDVNFKILFTGQHSNLVDPSYKLYKSYFCVLKQEFTDKAYYIDKLLTINNNNRLNAIGMSCLNADDNIWDNVSYCMIQGDTTSSLFIALNAFHHKIPIIHIEAGLRTYMDYNPYPEEMNRKLIDQISYILFCPTYQNYGNLLKENIINDNFFSKIAYTVGNTVLDNIKYLQGKETYNNEIIVTMHRRENENSFKDYFERIELMAKKFDNYKFIIYAHPNPIVQEHLHVFNKVLVENPLRYDEFIDKLLKCAFVITDSGGLQEECSFLNKRCIVCRQTTERTETLGKNSFMCIHPTELNEFRIKKCIENMKIKYECPYGIGNTSQMIFDLLKQNNII